MSDAYQLYRQGLDALSTGHADEAIAPLERAKKLEPDSNSIHEALGQTYLRLGFFERAADEFEHIVETEPVDAYAHYCLGRAYDRLGRRTAARRHYHLATWFDPSRRIYRATYDQYVAREELEADDDGTGDVRVFGD